MSSSSPFPLHLPLFLLACFSLLRFAFPVVALFVSWPPFSFVSWSHLVRVSRSYLVRASRSTSLLRVSTVAVFGVSVGVLAARLDRASWPCISAVSIQPRISAVLSAVLSAAHHGRAEPRAGEEKVGRYGSGEEIVAQSEDSQWVGSGGRDGEACEVRDGAI